MKYIGLSPIDSAAASVDTPGASACGSTSAYA
jgi:hypothetical protein